MKNCRTIGFTLFMMGCGASNQPAGTVGPSTPGNAAEVAAPAEAPPVRAVASLVATSGSQVSGTIELVQSATGVTMKVSAAGLTPGDHGFHIHEKGDCSSPDGKSAGDHFNPGQSAHGAPGTSAHHAGDFGNLSADANGNASMEGTFDFISLLDGPTQVLGRAFIIHEKADDLTTQPTGNAGARIACGVITKSP